MTQFFIVKHYKDNSVWCQRFFRSTTTWWSSFILHMNGCTFGSERRSQRVVYETLEQHASSTNKCIDIVRASKDIGFISYWWNPQLLLYSATESSLLSLISSVDFVIKYRITTRLLTNLKSNCNFFIDDTRHVTPARIMN